METILSRHCFLLSFVSISFSAVFKVTGSISHPLSHLLQYYVVCYSSAHPMFLVSMYDAFATHFSVVQSNDKCLTQCRVYTNQTVFQNVIFLKRSFCTCRFFKAMAQQPKETKGIILVDCGYPIGDCQQTPFQTLQALLWTISTQLTLSPGTFQARVMFMGGQGVVLCASNWITPRQEIAYQTIYSCSLLHIIASLG